MTLVIGPAVGTISQNCLIIGIQVTRTLSVPWSSGRLIFNSDCSFLINEEKSLYKCFMNDANWRSIIKLWIGSTLKLIIRNLTGFRNSDPLISSMRQTMYSPKTINEIQLQLILMTKYIFHCFVILLLVHWATESYTWTCVCFICFFRKSWCNNNTELASKHNIPTLQRLQMWHGFCVLGGDSLMV